MLGNVASLAIDSGPAQIDRYNRAQNINFDIELNGQPRPMRVAKAGLAAARKGHAKAEEGNALHVPAPMPGTVATAGAWAKAAPASTTPPGLICRPCTTSSTASHRWTSSPSATPAWCSRTAAATLAIHV